jgi:hypothetical protein
MVVRPLLWLAVIAVLGAPVAAQAPAASPLIGTWLLESIVDTLPDGSATYWMGRRPTGAIVYLASGHMSVQFMRDPRPMLPEAALDAARLAGARPFAGLSADQARDLLDGYYAYFGRYQLNPAGDSVAHYVETSLRPAEVGAVYRRQVRVEGDRLYISLHATEDGVPRHRVLTWQRAVVAPMHREPRHHLVLETPGVRVMDVRIPPRDTTIYHHHEFATLYVAINVSVTDGQPIGRAWGGALPTDDPRWQPGAADVDSSYAATPLTHRVTNVGSGPFRLLAISVKDNAPVVHGGELPGRLETTSSWFRWSRVALTANQSTEWFTATSPTLVVQPLAGETEVVIDAMTERLSDAGAWRLVARGQRYRIRNVGPSAGTTLVIQTP